MQMGTERVMVCSTLYNDKGFGQRSLYFIRYTGGKPQVIGRLDDCSDDIITNFDIDGERIVVLGLQGNVCMIEFL